MAIFHSGLGSGRVFLILLTYSERVGLGEVLVHLKQFVPQRLVVKCEVTNVPPGSRGSYHLYQGWNEGQGQ